MARLFGLETQSSVVSIPVGDMELSGLLGIPDGAQAVVIFAEGRGDARTNAIDTFLASSLQKQVMATLLLNLYTPDEMEEDLQDAHLRFNVNMLGTRLATVADWLIHFQPTHHMNMGCVGCSTGAAAALLAAGKRPETINAIVCCSGRPDLATSAMEYVHSPTLLLVGENDRLVMQLNEMALDQMTYPVRRLFAIPLAGHDFHEPGALEILAEQTCKWFEEHLAGNSAK